MLLSRFVMGMVSIGLLSLGASVVSGQDYPNTPIRVVTSAAGGGNDFETRLIAQGIAGSLGRPLIVDNRTARISAEIVWQAAPDGYTLLYQSSNIFVVHPSLPVKSVKDLIALARAKRPRQAECASCTADQSRQALSGHSPAAREHLIRQPDRGNRESVSLVSTLACWLVGALDAT